MRGLRPGIPQDSPMALEYVSLAPLINWRGNPRPLNWTQHFGRRAPLELDLGCGNGQRLVERAQRHPELNLVGLDLNWGSIRRALRKIAVAGVANVRLLQVRAEPGLKLLFEPGQISGIEVLFPMPWPAERNADKRVMNQGLLRLANSRLQEGGGLSMVTDHRDYWLWAMEQAKGTGFSLQVRTRPAGLGTKYERKWQSRGQSLFYEMNLLKREAVDIPAWEDQDLRPYRIARMNPRLFPIQNIPGDPFIAFIDIIYDESRGRAMLRCVVEEDGLSQPFWLEFVRHDADWELRPAPNCPLVPTQGVLQAMEHAARLAGETWSEDGLPISGGRAGAAKDAEAQTEGNPPKGGSQAPPEPGARSGESSPDQAAASSPENPTAEPQESSPPSVGPLFAPHERLS